METQTVLTPEFAAILTESIEQTLVPIVAQQQDQIMQILELLREVQASNRLLMSLQNQD